MKKILHLIKRKFLYFLFGALILVIAISLIVKNGNNHAPEIRVELGTVIQEIESSGKTKPIESVDLAFEKGGLVRSVNVKIGDQIVSGQALVSLDTSELSAQLLESEANLDAQKATLEKLKIGKRPEEITIQETKVQNAAIALENSRIALTDSIKDAHTKSNDAIRNKTDQVFINPMGTPELSFKTSNTILGNEVTSGRVVVENLLRSWEGTVANLTAYNDLDFHAEEAKTNLDQIRIFLDKITTILNGSTDLSASTLETYKANVSASRTTLNTTTNALTSAIEKYRTAKSNLILEENQLALDKAGVVLGEILTQEAKVKEAQAKVQAILSQLGKTTIRSPISGIVSKQEAKVGEIVGANINIVSVINEGGLEIEADIPEINIGNVMAGNSVSIDFDAISGEKFTGKVTRIDPSETIVNGVVNFRTIVSINEIDPRLKSGLTANLIIETGRKENVQTVPRFALKEENNQFFATKAGSQEKVPVEVGLIGRDGKVEIISGLSIGDIILGANNN